MTWTSSIPTVSFNRPLGDASSVFQGENTAQIKVVLKDDSGGNCQSGYQHKNLTAIFRGSKSVEEEQSTLKSNLAPVKRPLWWK